MSSSNINVAARMAFEWLPRILSAFYLVLEEWFKITVTCFNLNFNKYNHYTSLGSPFFFSSPPKEKRKMKKIVL